MGEPGRPHCLGRGCEGTPVGAAHSIRPRWEATWPGSKPGTTGSLWDRLGDLVLSILALLSLTPQAPGTHMVAGDCLVADGRTAIINVTLFAGRPWAQIQPPPTHTPRRGLSDLLPTSVHTFLPRQLCAWPLRVGWSCLHWPRRWLSSPVPARPSRSGAGHNSGDRCGLLFALPVQGYKYSDANGKCSRPLSQITGG